MQSPLIVHAMPDDDGYRESVFHVLLRPVVGLVDEIVVLDAVDLRSYVHLHVRRARV